MGGGARAGGEPPAAGRGAEGPAGPRGGEGGAGGAGGSTMRCAPGSRAPRAPAPRPAPLREPPAAPAPPPLPARNGFPTCTGKVGRAPPPPCPRRPRGGPAGVPGAVG